jgi:hypothetical protein
LCRRRCSLCHSDILCIDPNIANIASILFNWSTMQDILPNKCYWIGSTHLHTICKKWATPDIHYKDPGTSDRWDCHQNNTSMDKNSNRSYWPKFHWCRKCIPWVIGIICRDIGTSGKWIPWRKWRGDRRGCRTFGWSSLNRGVCNSDSNWMNQYMLHKMKHRGGTSNYFCRNLWDIRWDRNWNGRYSQWCRRCKLKQW